MRKELLIALVSSLVEEVVATKLQVVKGPRGLSGRDGHSFYFDEHQEEIQKQVSEYIESIKDSLKLQFDSLSEEDRISLKGKDGKDGRDFCFEDHTDSIQEEIHNFIDGIRGDLALKFSDLSEEQISSLRGPRGQKGSRGSGFNFEEERENLTNLIQENSEAFKLRFSELTHEDRLALTLKFSDLTEEQILNLRGPRGQKGQKGERGDSFQFENERENILSALVSIFEGQKSQFKLKFSDLTEEDVESLKGPKGQRGPKGNKGDTGERGDSFQFENERENLANLIQENANFLKLKFSDLTVCEKDSLKLKFSELNEEEISSLRGPRGQKGQRGRSFDFDSECPKILDSINSIISDRRSELSLTFDKLSEAEKESLKGGQGERGHRGILGLKGQDGKDAPFIYDVEVEQINSATFILVFLMSDGTRIESGKIDLPRPQNVFNNYVSMGGGEGGSGISAINVEHTGALVKSTDTINFIGDNITVTENGDKVNIEVEDPEIGIFKNGETVTTNLSSIDFLGDGFEIENQTMMGDWESLDDVNSLSGYEVEGARAVKIRIIPQTAVESAEFLVVRRVLDEDCVANILVSASSGTNVVIASPLVEAKSRVLGISLGSGVTGDTISILLFGNRVDASFNFGLNKHLYLVESGLMSETPPIPTVGQTRYITEVAFSNGSASIFIGPKSPIEVVG